MKFTSLLVMMFVASVMSGNPFQQAMQAASQGIGEGFQDIKGGIQGIAEGVYDITQPLQTELHAVKHPLLGTVSYAVSSQCTHVKKLFGVTLEQMEGKKEPDMNLLKLVYRTREFTRVYNISSAAEDLQKEGALQTREKLVVYVHGFTDSPFKEGSAKICDSLLKSEEGDRLTVLALDGSALIQWMYFRSSTYITFMGRKLAEVLTALVKGGLLPSQIHMVGHSLGAHISSFAGKQFYYLTGKKLGRISGLDPAGPCFTHVDPTFRLQKSDAEYVDVIHSDADVYGMKSAVGHSDYFPNSGAQQPGCLFETCSHMFACSVFEESILSRQAFPARRCNSWEDFVESRCDDEISYMGYASKPGTRGLFYLQTGSKSPYGLGEAGLNYNNNIGIVRNLEGVIKKVPGLKYLPILG